MISRIEYDGECTYLEAFREKMEADLPGSTWVENSPETETPNSVGLVTVEFTAANKTALEKILTASFSQYPSLGGSGYRDATYDLANGNTLAKLLAEQPFLPERCWNNEFVGEVLKAIFSYEKVDDEGLRYWPAELMSFDQEKVTIRSWNERYTLILEKEGQVQISMSSPSAKQLGLLVEAFKANGSEGATFTVAPYEK